MDNLASRIDKIVAYIIDSIIISILLSVISYWIFDFNIYNETKWENAPFLGLFTIYFVLTQLFYNGKSIGKLMMNIKVVKENESKAGFKDYIVREFVFASLLPFLTLGFFGFIDIMVSLFREDKKCLHDILSKTIVIKDYK